MNTLSKFLVGVALCASPADAHGEVHAIATGGNPASLVVYGPGEATAALSDGTVLAARTTVGKGRLCAIGHGGFLSDERADTREFVLGELAWLADGRPRCAWGVPEPLRKALEARGVRLAAVGGEPGGLDLASVDMIIGSPQAFARAGRLDDLRAWLEAGGAMLSAETAWGQIQLGHASGVEDLAANRLLGAHGIVYTDRALSPGHDGLYALDPIAAATANADRSLRVLAGEEAGDQVKAARIVRTALATVPMDSPLIRAADLLAGRHADALTEAYRSMADGPLKLTEQPLACALLDLESRRASADPRSAKAHPSAHAFPGLVAADAPRLARVVTFDDGIAGWRSTGLYAAPGEELRVRAESGGAVGVWVQIGAWLDPQDFDDRVRMPVAVFRSAVVNGRGGLRSPIGGPVYLDLPADAARRGVRFEISGAVEMPRFRLGHTDLGEWRDRIRSLGAPWAELESDALVLTIPAQAVRDLDRPDLVMEHWDRVHGAMQAMEPRTPGHWPDRQYRYVADRRLSWGYMYCPSDAPIVIPMTEARPMVEIANFDGEGPNELWGQYHEMGHSHQNEMWTFDGTGEVTVNIFTVLALNTVNGYPLNSEAMRTDPATALATMERHRAEGAPFNKWKSDPFLALQTYALLWHAFGWDAFRETFRSYDGLTDAARPQDDQDKRDEFAIRFGRTVGRDLGPYFAAWGVPITDRVGKALAGLPKWMPDGLSGD